LSGPSFVHTVEYNLLTTATASDHPVNAGISSLQNAAPTCICNKRIHTQNYYISV